MISNVSRFSLKDIYQKISLDNADIVIQKFHENLEKNECIWTSFVYFAALEMSGWYQNNPDAKYQKALAESDIILADGIAFRLLHYVFFHTNISTWNLLFHYQKYSKLAVENLNGTDFIPKLLRSFSGKNIEVILYGTTEENLPKAVEYVQKEFGLSAKGTHGYTPFPLEILEGDSPVIFLVGLGTPRQEKWILEHQELLRKRGNILVFGVGGLFDFWGGLEKRAPAIFQKMNIEWLWRLLSFPRKNFRKVVSSFLFFVYILRR